jgi:hypothetical protein
MKTRTFVFLTAVACNFAFSQNAKEVARSNIASEDYAGAVRNLEQYVKAHPGDAEAWYELGHSLHWLCYDSVPPSGDDRQVSNRILECLRRALSLDPNLRDCYGVIGSEHGARAVKALQKGQWTEFISELRNGRKAGGYPDWLVENARNILQSCNKDAILFVGGDPEIFPVWYCQFVEGIRTDVSVIPVALMDRPWFVLLLKAGMGKSSLPLPVTWSRERIMEMHPYKWTYRSIELPIPPETRRQFGVNDSVCTWILPPDLKRDERDFLSSGRALTLDIIKADHWRRPVHFSLGCQPWMLANLSDHLRFHGLTQEMVPFSMPEGVMEIDFASTVAFLENPENFRNFATVKDQDIPEFSPILHNYRMVYLKTCDLLAEKGDFRTARDLLKSMDAYLSESAFPIPDEWKTQVSDIRHRIEATGQ